MVSIRFHISILTMLSYASCDCRQFLYRHVAGMVSTIVSFLPLRGLGLAIYEWYNMFHVASPVIWMFFILSLYFLDGYIDSTDSTKSINLSSFVTVRTFIMPSKWKMIGHIYFCQTYTFFDLTFGWECASRLFLGDIYFLPILSTFASMFDLFIFDVLLGCCINLGEFKKLTFVEVKGSLVMWEDGVLGWEWRLVINFSRLWALEFLTGFEDGW